MRLPAKMCVVVVPLKLYCTLLHEVHSFKAGKVCVIGKQCNITGILENLLYLLLTFIQNLKSTFSIWSQFSSETCFVYYTILSCQIWKPVHILTSKFCGINSVIGYNLVKQRFYTLMRCYTCQKNVIFYFNFKDF